jgi:tetratricopeptide (TPR) repeat protein
MGKKVMVWRCLVGILAIALLVLTPVAPGWAQTAPIEVTDVQLQLGDELRTKAFTATNQGDFVAAEQYWTELLDLFPQNPAIWSNRGNSRVSQNKLDLAIADFNRSIEILPDRPDAYLNRGTALEGLGKWQDAIADYEYILTLDPKDAMAYNNLGNAYGGLGDWDLAIVNYLKASEIAPNFAFARANYALALYETGQTSEAMRTLKNIVRKYRDFPDPRAALSAVLWHDGQRGEAESNWVSVIGLDSRYKDLDWVKNTRRWPPTMVAALEKFLKLQ